MTDDMMKTQRFEKVKDLTSKETILKEVYNSLKEKGYEPYDQIIGYILSGDPTYITSHNHARSLIQEVEIEELLEDMLKVYLKE